MKKLLLRPLFLGGAWLLILAALLLQGPGNLAVPSSEVQSYIVQGRDVEQVAHLVQRYSGTVTSRLAIVNGVGALLPVDQVPGLQAEPGITNVIPNASVKLASSAVGSPAQVGKATSDYSEVVGANEVWTKEGVRGKGVTVAVVDTGIKATLAGLQKDTGNKNRVIGWQDFIGPNPSTKAVDPHGHGSHVAGIIANSDTGDDGVWNGIAPDVSLVGVRVLNGDGVGTYESVIQGIQWVVDNRELYNIKVMNLSIVATAQAPYWADPLNQAVMRAWANGITVVAAAGNNGPGAMNIGVPGNNPYVITVGAFTDNFTPNDWNDDYITPFSATGPTLDAFVKPDVVAPGAHMVSTMLSSAHLAQSYSANKIAGNYFKMAGTSHATAVVSGVVALTLSDNPDLSPDQVKYRLMRTARLWQDPGSDYVPYSIWQQGAGRVDAYNAVVSASQESANAGMNIQADLNGTEHYQGFTYYDEETGEFRLNEDPEIWGSGYTIWAGGYTIWAGGYTIWAGGYTIWAGGYTIWAGGYTIWAGGADAWDGSEPWAGHYDAPLFVANYEAGESPSLSTMSMTNQWVDELDWDDAVHTYLPSVLR